MSNQSDGGSAFPRIEHICLNEKSDEWGEVHAAKGMSIRDWFAGMALQGELANPSFDAITPGEYARDAYGLADAMLAARNGKERP